MMRSATEASNQKSRSQGDEVALIEEPKLTCPSAWGRLFAIFVCITVVTVIRHDCYLIDQLNPLNLAYLHLVEGATSREVPAGMDMDALSAPFNRRYIGNNNYDLEMAVQRRAGRKIDAVAFGGLFISNRDLVERLRHGDELTIAPRESYYGGDAKGYTDWPRAH